MYSGEEKSTSWELQQRDGGKINQNWRIHNWNEKHTGGHLQEIRGCRRTDQHVGRQGSRNHLNGRAIRKNKRTLKDLLQITYANIFIIGVSEGEEREKRDGKSIWRNRMKTFLTCKKTDERSPESAGSCRQHELQNIHINTHNSNVKSFFFLRENL